MSTKSKSIKSKTDLNQDERLKKVSKLRLLLNRPELGALGGAILVFIFFGIVAGDTGMFSAYGVLNFLDVSANLGIIAIAAAMLMIGGEFDLSIGSMIGFAGICIAIPAIYWGWPLWMSIIFAFSMAVLVGYFNGILVVRTGFAIIHCNSRNVIYFKRSYFSNYKVNNWSYSSSRIKSFN